MAHLGSCRSFVMACRGIYSFCAGLQDPRPHLSLAWAPAQQQQQLQEAANTIFAHTIAGTSLCSTKVNIAQGREM